MGRCPTPGHGVGCWLCLERSHLCQPLPCGSRHHRNALERSPLLRRCSGGGQAMKTTAATPRQRCAIYTRVSTDQGMDQDFNSLDAQREAAEAYVKSQRHEGWVALKAAYDDGGFSGGSMERPALQRLL